MAKPDKKTTKSVFKTTGVWFKPIKESPHKIINGKLYKLSPGVVYKFTVNKIIK
jgi:hypothetical protein